MVVTLDDINELGVRTFDVYIYHYGTEEGYETLRLVGTAKDIICGMDSMYLLDNLPDENWGEYWAEISYAGVDLVCMPDLSSQDYDIVVEDSALDELSEERRAAKQRRRMTWRQLAEHIRDMPEEVLDNPVYVSMGELCKYYYDVDDLYPIRNADISPVYFGNTCEGNPYAIGLEMDDFID
jgi:hypothetical protein